MRIITVRRRPRVTSVLTTGVMCEETSPLPTQSRTESSRALIPVPSTTKVAEGITSCIMSAASTRPSLCSNDASASVCEGAYKTASASLLFRTRRHFGLHFALRRISRDERIWTTHVHTYAQTGHACIQLQVYEFNWRALARHARMVRDQHAKLLRTILLMALHTLCAAYT